MRFSEAIGRQVVSTSTAVTVGKIDEFVVDPVRRAVAAVRLKKADGGDTLMWADITAFGQDAVTVSGAERIHTASPDIQELTGKVHQLIGKRVLSTAGDELGNVMDVEFDSATGTIIDITLADLDIAGARLLGVGSYAVVVHLEPSAGQ